jgi:CheY-like chemotaxis protein
MGRGDGTGGHESLPGEADVRVLIVDDHDFFRGVLRELVDATPGFAVVGEAASGEDALPAVGALAAQYLLMDVRMPGTGGIEVARALLELHPELVVLLVSAQDLPESPPWFSGRAVFLAPKRDLCATLLREVWAARKGSG